MHDAGAGVVAGSVAQAPAIAHLCQPAAAPHPASEDRVDEGADEEAEDEEALEAPPLGAGASYDGGGGVHEDHHEQEPDCDGTVIALAGGDRRLAAQKVTGVADDAPAVVLRAVILHGRTDGDHRVERRNAAKLAGAADVGAVGATAHEGEAADEEAEHPKGVDHEVHGHGVGGVFATDQAGFDQCETRLHEHDQEAADQRPSHIDGVVGPDGGCGFLIVAERGGLGSWDRRLGIHRDRRPAVRGVGDKQRAGGRGVALLGRGRGAVSAGRIWNGIYVLVQYRCRGSGGRLRSRRLGVRGRRQDADAQQNGHCHEPSLRPTQQ